MEIDLALNNEVEDFKEDYESIYLETVSYTHLDVYKRQEK